MDGIHRKRGKTGIVGAAGHKIELPDEMWAMEFSGLLNNHYPGYQWAVHVNSEGGVVDISNWTIIGNYGFRILNPWNRPHDQLRHEIIMAGGELLERAGLRRGKFDPDMQVDKIEGARTQDQPYVLWNIQKYAELLDAPTSK
jgi:hypothetical protein